MKLISTTIKITFQEKEKFKFKYRLLLLDSNNCLDNCWLEGTWISTWTSYLLLGLWTKVDFFRIEMCFVWKYTAYSTLYAVEYQMTLNKTLVEMSSYVIAPLYLRFQQNNAPSEQINVILIFKSKRTSIPSYFLSEWNDEWSKYYEIR